MVLLTKYANHEDINKRLDENLYEISEIFNETSKRLNRTNKVAIL